jgi:hypothetical protein
VAIQVYGRAVSAGPPGLPPPIGGGARSPGRGPFGQAAFNAALIGCAVLVVLGLVMAVVGGRAVNDVGVVIVVVALVAAGTSGSLLALERWLHRRPPPSGEAMRSNGHSPDRPRFSRRQ